MQNYIQNIKLIIKLLNFQLFISIINIISQFKDDI